MRFTVCVAGGGADSLSTLLQRPIVSNQRPLADRASARRNLAHTAVFCTLPRVRRWWHCSRVN